MQSLQKAVDNWKRMIGNLDDYRLMLEGEEDEDGSGSDVDDVYDSGDDSEEDGDGGDGGSVRHPCAAGGSALAIPG